MILLSANFFDLRAADNIYATSLLKIMSLIKTFKKIRIIVKNIFRINLQ